MINLDLSGLQGIRPHDGMGWSSQSWMIRFGEYCSRQSFGKTGEQYWADFVSEIKKQEDKDAETD